MAETTLVGFDVASGEKVLDGLREAGVRIAVALWAKTSDYDEPRLFIASPDFNSASKLEAYTRVDRAIQSKFVWSAPNIMVLPMTDPMIVVLQRLFGSTRSVSGMRLGGQMIGNRYLEDAYVYQIENAKAA
ncbi:hypothetical protein [Terriglobus sp. RCC_193]|uniref:hypothetical protein n=1 Tax=Terriglobus sp. RCC_193 TaxID=3239218 RepID=UPI0035242725